MGENDDFVHLFRDACLKDDKKKDYNQEITIGELLRAVQESKVKSPGFDCISNIFLKNLPENRLVEFLNIINQVLL